jgi:hypothetical protein
MKLSTELKRWLIHVVVILYLASILLPAMFVDVFKYDLIRGALFVPTGHVVVSEPGYYLLVIGWFGAFGGVFAWYANPLGIFAFLLAKAQKFKMAMYLSICAAILAAQMFVFALLHAPIALDFGDLGCPGLDRYPCVRLDHLAIGFYAWLAAFLLLALHCYLSGYRKRESATAIKSDRSDK